MQLLILLIASTIPGITSRICAEYSQEFASNNNGIDASKSPSTPLVVSTNCTGCFATIQNGHFQTGCIRQDSDFGSFLCSNTTKLFCDEKSCCCRGWDCYDILRNHFAVTPAADDTKCIIQRKTLLETSDRYLRTSCSICVAEYIHKAIETKCVDSENLNNECSAATELVGGSLACTENHKKCCCRAKKCQIQFENFFFKQGELGKSRISEPYLIEPEDSKALPVLTNLGVYVCVILFVYVW